MEAKSRRCDDGDPNCPDGWTGYGDNFEIDEDCSKTCKRYTCPNGGTLGDGKEPTKDKSRCYYK